MSRVEVKQKIRVYEVNGNEVTLGEDDVVLGVNSHWIKRGLVVLDFRGEQFAVAGDDLILATHNAMNAGTT